jgi:hypothetical protein
VLLPAFIEKTEYNIRNGTLDYNLLKYDYYFLVGLRNMKGDDAVKRMKEDKSYQAGKLLGRMAQPLGRGREPAIKSFEKNYVGLLSRRIADLDGLIELSNFINGKLLLHEVAYRSLKEASVELDGILTDLSEKEYRKKYCAFGFFEGYFARYEEATKPDTQATAAQANETNQ